MKNHENDRARMWMVGFDQAATTYSKAAQQYGSYCALNGMTMNFDQWFKKCYGRST